MKNKIYCIFSQEDEEDASVIAHQLKENGYFIYQYERTALTSDMIASLGESDFVLVFLSKHSTNYSDLFRQEVRIARRIWNILPKDEIYLIPIRLDEYNITIPFSAFGQIVDYYKKNGFDKLIGYLNEGAQKRKKRKTNLKKIYNYEKIELELMNSFKKEELSVINSPYLRWPFQDPENLSKQEIISILLNNALQEKEINSILNWIQVYKIENNNEQKSYWAENSFFQLNNPYIAGNPIFPENSEVFFGRLDVVRAVKNEIQSSGKRASILLYGRRRMGKTSILRNLIELANLNNLVSIFIDCQDARFRTDINLSFHLIDVIIKNLKRILIDTTSIEKEIYLKKKQFEKQPIVNLSNFFSDCDILLEKESCYCLIAFDEYEEICQISDRYKSDGISRDLWLTIRSVIQHRQRFFFIFSGTHYLSEISSINWNEIFINLSTLHISFLKREEGRKLLVWPEPRLEYRRQDQIEQILDLTGCQPFLLQSIAHEIIEILNERKRRTVTNEVLEKSIRKVINGYNNFFAFLWEHECATTRHKKILSIIVKNNNKLPKYHWKSLYYKDEVKDLIRKEILTIENKFIRLTIPIFMLWIEQNRGII